MKGNFVWQRKTRAEDVIETDRNASLSKARVLGLLAERSRLVSCFYSARRPGESVLLVQLRRVDTYDGGRGWGDGGTVDIVTTGIKNKLL